MGPASVFRVIFLAFCGQGIVAELACYNCIAINCDLGVSYCRWVETYIQDAVTGGTKLPLCPPLSAMDEWQKLQGRTKPCVATDGARSVCTLNWLNVSVNYEYHGYKNHPSILHKAMNATIYGCEQVDKFVYQRAFGNLDFGHCDLRFSDVEGPTYKTKAVGQEFVFAIRGFTLKKCDGLLCERNFCNSRLVFPEAMDKATHRPSLTASLQQNIPSDAGLVYGPIADDGFVFSKDMIPLDPIIFPLSLA